MTKPIEQKIDVFNGGIIIDETAAQIPFVKSDYFKGLCDLYLTEFYGKNPYITRQNIGILTTLLNNKTIVQIAVEQGANLFVEKISKAGKKYLAPNDTANLPAKILKIKMQELDNCYYFQNTENIAEFQEYIKYGQFSVFSDALPKSKTLADLFPELLTKQPKVK